VLFSRVKKPIMAMFKRSHMHEDVPKEFFHRNPVNVFDHAWTMIKESEEHEESEESSKSEDENNKSG
jgi:hypothetical protein